MTTLSRVDCMSHDTTSTPESVQSFYADLSKTSREYSWGSGLCVAWFYIWIKTKQGQTMDFAKSVVPWPQSIIISLNSEATGRDALDCAANVFICVKFIDHTQTSTT